MIDIARNILKYKSGKLLYFYNKCFRSVFEYVHSLNIISYIFKIDKKEVKNKQMNMNNNIIKIACIMLLVNVLPSCTRQEHPVIYKLDTGNIPAEILSGHLKMGGENPAGQEINANSLYITIDDKPVLPVMGEIHFSRFPHEYWESEILKMKANGINIIATYVFWIHHEEIEGEWDWSGDKNLRDFIELCAKHNIYVFTRIGPYAHGECRNSGFPDWLWGKSYLRTNDPVYFSYVWESYS